MKYTRHNYSVKIVCFLLSLLAPVWVCAQLAAHTVRGTVRDEQNTSIAYATVSLQRAGQSGVSAQTVFTDEEGLFTFPNVHTGDYVLEVSMIGYKALTRDITVDGDLQVDGMTMVADAEALEAVTVTGQRKVLDRKPDRFVMNVASSSFQASTVLEMFMSLPFMQVQGESFSINGKKNILVLLDNVQMPGMSVSQILNSMTGNDVDRIEFITTPGARYDASVDAVIHIHTKKGQTEGWTGSAVANYSRGDHDRGTVGANLTYRKGKWVIGGRYNYQYNDYYVDQSGYRTISSPEFEQTITNESREFYRNRFHNAKLDVAYEISRDHHVNVSVGWIPGDAPNSGFAGVSGFTQHLGMPVDSILRRKQDAYYQYNTQNYSVNYQGKLDTLGKRVDFIVTYTPVRNSDYSEMAHQEMYAPDGTLLASLPIIRNDNPTRADIWIAQNDWELPFRKGWQMEAGAKYSHSHNRSETFQSERVDDDWQELPDFTFMNRFYEDIVAGYLGVQKKFGQTTLRASVRGENTVMGVRGDYERNFFDLFPNVMLQQKLGDRTVMLNYRKSINRPGFNQMAHWRIYLDEYALVEGNPSLRPTYTDQLVLNGDLTGDLFLELEYNRQKGLINQLARQEGTQTVYAFENMNGSQWAASLNYDYRFTSWWTGGVNARGFRWAYDGFVNDDRIDDDGYAYTFGITGSFKLPAAMTMDATYNYESRNGYGGWMNRSTNFARLALRRSFLQDRMRVTLAMSDIFKGQVYRSTQQAGSLLNYYHNYYDSRRVSLGVVFNFGKKTVKQAESKKLGNEDLIDRAGG